MVTVKRAVFLGVTPCSLSFHKTTVLLAVTVIISMYRGADKSLARPGRKQATATEDVEFHMSNL